MSYNLSILDVLTGMTQIMLPNFGNLIPNYLKKIFLFIHLLMGDFIYS